MEKAAPSVSTAIMKLPRLGSKGLKAKPLCAAPCAGAPIPHHASVVAIELQHQAAAVACQARPEGRGWGDGEKGVLLWQRGQGR